ncbi:hypothetical protein MRX96_005964 [Rhipicephalus microplus]
MGFVVVFMLGATPYQEVQRKVSQEHDIHGVIVQVDIVDSYENLTYKSVMLLHWAREKCSDTDFVLKIDDDVLLRVWDLAVVANSLGGVKRSIWGSTVYDYGSPMIPKQSRMLVVLTGVLVVRWGSSHNLERSTRHGLTV